MRRWTVACTGVVVAGMLGTGGFAGEKARDISALRTLTLQDKLLPMAMRLPPDKPSGKKAPAPQKWVFKEVEEKKKADLRLADAEIARVEQIIADSENAEKNVQLKPGGKEAAEQYMASWRKVKQDIEAFYAPARIVCQDPEDPQIAVVIKAIEVNRAFTMKHAVGELKARLPPWHIGRVKDAGDMQLRADAADQRFGKWQGWKVLREFTTRLREDASTARFYDASYVFRNVVKGGRIVHVEIFAHWRVDQGKDKTFERQVDLLLSGLRF